MKKNILFLLVIALASFVGCSKNGEIKIPLNPSDILKQFDNSQAKALREAEAMVEAVNERVQTAKSDYAKVEVLINNSVKAKEKADAKIEKLVFELKFIGERVESGEPIRLTNGKTLSNAEIDAEIAKRECDLEGLRAVSEEAEKERVELEAELAKLADWAQNGKTRLETLQLKLRNMKELSTIQRRRLERLNGESTPTDLREAYEQALGAIDIAKAGIVESSSFDKTIDFNDKKTENDKLTARLEKINALIGDSNDKENSNDKDDNAEIAVE